MQFDPFGKVAAAEAAAATAATIAERRSRMWADLGSDWRHPGTHTRLVAPSGAERDGTRCGRCGEPCASYDLIINHHLGWLGCPADRAAFRAAGGRGWGRKLTAAELNHRADRAAFPDCARCGCAWGLHAHRGHFPADNPCYAWCGCRGYLAAPLAATPFGTCPGCWADPHPGPCAATRA